MTLVWNSEAVTVAIGSLFHKGGKAKYIDLPKPRSALYHVDAVLRNGEQIGVSIDCGYITNEDAPYVDFARTAYRAS